jgi:hypothetical protein
MRDIRRNAIMIHLFDITIFFLDIADSLFHNKRLTHPDNPMMVVYQTGNILTPETSARGRDAEKRRKKGV